jgi:hypothetical protein
MTEPMYCVNHPDVETRLRCNKCGRPICTKCAIRTPVGYRCSDCINTQQQVFYAESRKSDYLIAAAVALLLSLIAGWLIPSLGWFAIILGPVVGGGIAEAVRWATGRRRGKYIWLIVCGCIVVGALPQLLLSLLLAFGLATNPMGSGTYVVSLLGGWLWLGIYLVSAVGVAYARLRPGRRV